MDEIWERAVEAALDGQTDSLATRAMTLDGAVKCVQGRLPPPSLLERFQNLQHLSIANIGVSSLEQFPRLRNLQKLILSDNRMAGGLEFLVEAELDSLRDLDLSNNRIQYIEDLAPLAQLRLVSLDLYECPVTRVKDYLSSVFGLIKSLKYLDKTDVEGNERPESDDEEDEEDEDDEEDDVGGEEDPGSGEVDGEERPYRMSNGHAERLEGVVDEEEESDADDEEAEKERGVNGTSHEANGFRFQAVDGEGSESRAEIDEEGGDDEDDGIEVHEIEDSDNEEDGVDEVEDEEDDGDEEEVDNDDGDFGVPESRGRLMNTSGEIDGHEQGEDDDDGDDETGEDEQGVENGGEYEDEEVGEEEDEDYGEGYLVQPVGQVEDHHGAIGSGMDPGDEEDDPEEEEEVEDDDEVQVLPSSLSSSSRLKRKRDGDDDDDDDGVDDEDDDDDGGVDGEEHDDTVEYSKSSKKHC